jgi:hypothetical protein
MVDQPMAERFEPRRDFANDLAVFHLKKVVKRTSAPVAPLGSVERDRGWRLRRWGQTSYSEEHVERLD